MIPHNFRIELKVSYVDTPEVCTGPVVASCERLGLKFSSQTSLPGQSPKRIIFSSSILLNMLIFQKKGEAKVQNLGQVFNGKPISGVEPIRARLTLREYEQDGDIVDVASIDLAKYVVGSHGYVREVLDLQMGSVAEVEVTSDLEYLAEEEELDIVRRTKSVESLSNSKSSTSQTSSTCPSKSKVAVESSFAATVESCHEMDRVPSLTGMKETNTTVKHSVHKQNDAFKSEEEMLNLDCLDCNEDGTLKMWRKEKAAQPRERIIPSYGRGDESTDEIIDRDILDCYEDGTFKLPQECEARRKVDSATKVSPAAFIRGDGSTEDMLDLDFLDCNEDGTLKLSLECEPSQNTEFATKAIPSSFIHSDDNNDNMLDLDVLDCKEKGALKLPQEYEAQQNVDSETKVIPSAFVHGDGSNEDLLDLDFLNCNEDRTLNLPTKDIIALKRKAKADKTIENEGKEANIFDAMMDLDFLDCNEDGTLKLIPKKEEETTTSRENGEETLDFDSELEEYLMSNMSGSSTGAIDVATVQPSFERRVSNISMSKSAPIVSMVSAHHAKSDKQTGSKKDGSDGESGQREPVQTSKILIRSQSRDSPGGPRMGDCSEMPSDSDDSSPTGNLGKTLPIVERSDEDYVEGSEYSEEEQSRTILSYHVFTPLVLRRTPAQIYHSYTDEGNSEETPVVTELDSPLRITVWSIEGPEELDPDDDQDMMEMDDGTSVPKRNISKLRSAAAALETSSTTKASPSALPGNMSPLQRTYFVPSNVRQALYVAMGKPQDLKRCTVLAASKNICYTRVDVEDPPDISDSEEESENSGWAEGDDDEDEDEDEKEEKIIEQEDDEEKEESDEDSGLNSLRRVDRSLNLEQTIDFPGLGLTGDEDDQLKKPTLNPSPDKGTAIPSSKSYRIRQDANQSAELMNRINELEDEIHVMKQALKKSDIVIADLKKERTYLKHTFSEHEETNLEKATASGMNSAAMSSVLATKTSNRQPSNEETGSTSAEEIKEDIRIAKAAQATAHRELEILQAKVFQESDLRQENERLLTVILSLKQELDRKPATPEVLNDLKKTKSDLRIERAKAESLQFELIQMQQHGFPAAAKKPKKKFWS